MRLHFSAMQVDISKKVTDTCFLEMYGHSKQSGRSGLGPVTFLQTKHVHLHLELIIHVVF